MGHARRISPQKIMAYPSSDTEIDNSLQTRCSNCLTVFEVSRELLGSSDTRVRCGECLSIFDAREGLRDESTSEQSVADQYDGSVAADLLDASSQGEAEPADFEQSTDSDTNEEHVDTHVADSDADPSKDAALLDVTYSDFDLFSEDADLPEIAYFDQTRDTASFDFDTVVLEDDETFSDTLFAHDVTIDANVAQSEAVASVESADVEFISDEVPSEPLIFNYQDAEPVDKDALTGEELDSEAAPEPGEFDVIDEKVKSSSPWLLRGLLLITLTSLLGSLYLYRERDRLSNNPIARPFLEAGCMVFRCDVAPRTDLSALKAVQRKAFSHPTADNALVLTMGVRNDAAFAQALPVLAISLTDTNGRTVAQRNFSPKDYLDTWQAGDTIAQGKRLDVTLEVKDPGNRATGFQLQFRSLPK